jgi:reactive intermediate/imine deaminase
MTHANENVRFINPAILATPNGYSHVVEVKAGRTLYISGQVALDQNGKLVGAGNLDAQTEQVFKNLQTALESVGADFSHVIKLTYYLVDISQIALVREVRNRYFTSGQFPASTAMEVSRLVQPDWLIEVDAIAYLPD